MSAEAYAEALFAAAVANSDFLQRLYDAGAAVVGEVLVVADSTPVGEVLGRAVPGHVVAVLDEDAPHGFGLATLERLDQ